MKIKFKPISWRKIFIVVALSIVTVVGSAFLADTTSTNPNVKPVETQTSEFTPQSQVYSKPEVKSQKTYNVQPTPTQDPDPIVECTFKTGSVKLKKSECDSYVNCQLDGKWYELPREKCKELQNNRAKSQNTLFSYPTPRSYSYPTPLNNLYITPYPTPYYTPYSTPRYYPTPSLPQIKFYSEPSPKPGCLGCSIPGSPLFNHPNLSP